MVSTLREEESRFARVSLKRGKKKKKRATDFLVAVFFIHEKEESKKKKKKLLNLEWLSEIRLKKIKRRKKVEKIR